MKTNHGGRRKGAGRKSTGRSNRKTLFLSDASIEILSQVPNASEFTDSAISSYFGSRNKVFQDELRVAEAAINHTAEQELKRISEFLQNI